jgi:tetratricopeptide (TPR) repeat protein
VSDNDVPVPSELTDAQRAELAQLDEALEKFVAQKRWSDVIKTTLAKAEIVVDPAQKVALLSEAGRAYIERSSNQAEAIKCFARVLELEPTNTEAITLLKDMYEKRRDWESLVGVMQRECELLDPADQALRRVEIAQLATEKLRKPNVCIDLWQDVLKSDPSNVEALGALAGLYEKAREWEPLAVVLERQSESVSDPTELGALLQKLGMIYADKLTNDEGAVSAFKRLLQVQPDDRRAQEQLKKRFVALHAWDDLEAFYATSDKQDELIRTLERVADAQETALEERIALHFRVARLWQQKQAADRAARAFEKVLGLDKSNLAAAEALTPIYESANDAKKLVGVYEIRLEHIEDPEARVMLLREAGLLYEEKLKNPAEAFERFLGAFALDPRQEVLREDLERLAGKVKDWDRVFAAYATAIENAAHPDDANDLRIHYGRALVEAQRIEEAVAQFRAVYDDRTDDAQAIAALESLYRQTSNFAELMNVLQRRAELETDQDVRKQLAYAIAKLWHEHLEDADQAIDAYRAITAEFGEGETEAYRALDTLYERQERWQDLAQGLEHRIDLGPESDEELAALKFRLANTLREHLDDKERALDLYREVVMLLPEHEGAIQAVEGLLADAKLGAAAAGILEPLYESAGAWEKLVRALEISLGAVEDPDSRIDVITKMGEICAEQLRDASRAFDIYTRAVREAPSNPGIRARMEELAADQRRFGELVAVLDTLATESEEPDLARSLWIRAAQLQDTQLSDTDAAVALYMKVIERDEGDLEVLSALEELYTRTSGWRELLGVLRKRARAVTEPGEQERILSTMARIHDEKLKEPKEAIAVLAEVLELDPASRDALSALDGLYERQGMWNQLADNVHRRLSLADSEEETIQLMLRLGQLRETRMEAVESAIETYSEILDRDPRCQPALEALERLIGNETFQVQIADLLEPLYRDANEFAKLIGVHEIQVGNSDSADRRVELLGKIAELYENSLGDAQQAFSAHARALAQDPGNEATQRELDRIAMGADAWQALTQVYEGLVAKVDDPTLAAQLHAKVANIYETQLSAHDDAIRHYALVMQLDGTNAEAASALERLYQATERYEELAGVYLVKARLVESPEERKDYFFRAGAIFEQVLERPSQAVDVFKQALDMDSEDVSALDKLIALYLKLESWEKLLAVYSQKADLVADPQERMALLGEVGAVYERELKESGKAIETYQRMLELDPDDSTALARLDILYQSTENWDELLSVLEREAELAGDPSDAISFRYRIAELFETRLGDNYRAVEGYREILDAAPDHGLTLTALERMIAAAKEPVAAASVLEPIYRSSGESARLVGVLEVLVRHEEDPVRKVELLHQIADLHEVHLDQPALAFDAYARAIESDSDNGTTLGSVERLADQLNRWPEVAKLYDVQIAKLREASPESAVELALRLAQIFEVQIGEVDSAIARYRIVFDADPGHVQALEALDRLYEATGRWKELVEILEREAEVAASPDDVLNLQYRLGQVYQTRLGEVDRAIGQYRDILAAAPEHTQSMDALEGLFAQGTSPMVIGEILEPLYRMQEAWDRLIRVHQVQLKSQGDREERIVMMHRISEIAEERALDAEVAFTWMQRAFMEDPSHDHSGDEVERLAGMLDGWKVLASTYAQVLSAEHPVAVLTSVGKRAARVYEEELSDVVRAEETYRFVVHRNDADPEILEALDRIYTAHGAGEALASVLKMRAAAATDTQDKVELSHRLGHVLFNDVGRTEEAIGVYRGILDDLDPQHEATLHDLQNIYTATQDWQKLYDTYARELGVVTGDSVQAEILGRMALLAMTRLNDLDKSVEMLRRVLDLLGEEPEALNALGNIYAVQEKWADLVDVLEREVAVTNDDQMRLNIYSDLGRIWYEKLHRDRNALESWERVLDLDPSNTDALFAMASIHRAAEANNDLVDTLHRIIDVGTATLSEQRIEDVYMQLGQLYDQKLQQPSDAVDSYQKALELNPRNMGALDALEAIHTGQQQWEDCIKVKDQRVSALDDVADKIQVLLDSARMWEGQLEQRDGATDPYRRILELDPLHEFAFEQLETLHREQERFEQLVDMYVARVEATEQVGPRVNLLRRVATVYEKDMGDKNQAFDALQLAWTQDFTNEDTARDLERITGLTQRWNELLTTANQCLQELPAEDLESRNAICIKAARWYGREGHPEYAIPYLQQVLNIDPVNRPAMKQMAELYRQTQQWQVYGQVLNKLAEMTEDPAEKAEVCVSMGELNEEQFHAAEQAIKHYQEALECVPTHMGALKSLERMYRAREQWLDLIDILKRKVKALSGDPEQVLIARIDLAEAYEDRISDKSLAIAQYREVLRDDVHNIQALKGLERLFARQELWADLLANLETQLEIVSTERERVTLLMRIAGMQEEEFRSAEKAVERFEQVVDLDPTHNDALQGLERLYRKLTRWDQLITTYQRHIDAVDDRIEKVELYAHVGAVYRDQLSDQERAIDAFIQVTDIDPDNRAALAALASLYQVRGEHSSSLEMMEKLSYLIEDSAEQVALYFRMGQLYDKELGDRINAVEYFQRAIAIDDRHLQSLEAMRDIHVDNGDWNAAAEVLEQACEVEQDARKAAAFRVELGHIFDDRLSQHDRAIQCFEQAQQLNPDSEEAALPLVDEYTRSERWAEAMPLLQMLTKNPGSRAAEENHRLWQLYGQCADHTGNDVVAIEAYTQALTLDSQHLPSLMGVAFANYRSKDWDNAFKYYQMVLVHHRDELGRAETTDTFYRLGVIKREQGERKKALNMFDKALEEDGYHRPTLEALIALYEEQKEFEQVIHYKKILLEVTESEEERYGLLEQIGDLWETKVKNPVKAIEAFQEASGLQPSNHKMLHKLLGLYQSTAQWASAIEIIDKVGELDGRAEAKAKYAYTIGVILRDELKDPVAALERFNTALDSDSAGMLKAFEAINKILTQQKDWKQLERAFRKMLHRVSGKGDDALEFNLWHNLGVIYRDRQKNLEASAEAFTMASRLQPDNVQEHQILAELYTMVPGRMGDAINEHQVLLKRDPYRVDSYRALYKIYFEAREYDKAWCVASTLGFLKKADSEQRQFYEQYRPEGPIKPRSRLSNERWVKDLFHTDEDFLVGKLFEAITPAILRRKAQTDKALQLKKKEEIPDVMNTTVTFARSFGFAVQVLGIQITPRLFVCPERQGGLAYAPTMPPASVCGSALLRGMDPLDVMFVVAKHLTYYRGEHYIRTLFQTKDEMKLVLLAAMQIAGVEIKDPNVTAWAAEIRQNMQPADMELLNKVGKRFVDAGARTDIKLWMQTVEMTACRAGFLLANNLDIAQRMIQLEPPMGAVELTPREKVEDLVLFSVSENYFRLREALGIQIQVG